MIWENGRTNAMTTSTMETVEQVWPSLAPLLFVPHSEHEYDQLVQMLDALIDVVGEDEMNPLASLMEVIGVLVEKYEEEHVPELS
jgi:HTH-type transcriptional regulator/antitoxin HigA